MKNKRLLRQMIHMSRIICDLRCIRCNTHSVNVQSLYCIISGDNLIEQGTRKIVESCLYMEQHLRSSVSELCKCLDGFKTSKFDIIDYISSSDIKSKSVDLCHKNKVIGRIDLTDGKIYVLGPELEESAEEESPTEKS